MNKFYSAFQHGYMLLCMEQWVDDGCSHFQKEPLLEELGGGVNVVANRIQALEPH